MSRSMPFSWMTEEDLFVVPVDEPGSPERRYLLEDTGKRYAAYVWIANSRILVNGEPYDFKDRTSEILGIVGQASEIPSGCRANRPAPMRGNRAVTPVTADFITPRIYLDLEYYQGKLPETPAGVQRVMEIKRYKDLGVRAIGQKSPDGQPVFRIEGPMPEIIKWLSDCYDMDEEDINDALSQAGLAQ